ncbi:hypothetical protein [Arthrobacter sp. HS15c]|uniref:hypothetical protein n=1 Tax=Arthrobacter sp. HS15c TaxID=3230279 RepID=UPI00346596FE
MQLPLTIRRASSAGLLLRTGEHCTETGWWTPQEGGGPRYVTQGSLMPSVEGQAVLWGSGEQADCAATCTARGRCRRAAPAH